MNLVDDEAASYDEFAFLEQYARHEGIPWDGPPEVSRRTLSVDPDDSAETAESAQVISALVWGSGNPEIVLLHGGGQNAHTWDSVAMALGRPLVAFDLPGHGHSSWREDTDYSPRTNAKAIAAAMRQLAPAPDVVVGMSLGGMTTISLAAQFPELVARFVIVDITPGSVARHGTLTREQLGAVALISGPPEFDSFDDLLAAAAAAVPDRPLESLRPGALHNSRQREDGRWVWRYDRLRAQRSPADPNRVWDELAATTAPALLVKGAKSPFVHESDRAEFIRRRPGTRFVEVEGAHHSVQSDRPIQLAELIADFRQTSDG